MKKFIQTLKTRLIYKKYAYTGKYESYKQAMENQKLSKKKYDTFLNSYFKTKTDIFYDETKVKIYGRFRFFLSFLKNIKKKKIIIFEVGGGSNPIFSYIKKSLNIEVFTYVLEVKKFVNFFKKKIPKKYQNQIKYLSSYKDVNFNKIDIVFFGSSFQYLKNIDSLLDYFFKGKIKYIIISDICLTNEEKSFWVLGYKDEPLVLPCNFYSYKRLILKFKMNKYFLFKRKKMSVINNLHKKINPKSYAKYNLIFKKI